MLKYLAPAGAVLGFALTAFADPIQVFIAAHPVYTGLFAAIAALAAAVAPQPHK